MVIKKGTPIGFRVKRNTRTQGNTRTVGSMSFMNEKFNDELLDLHWKLSSGQFWFVTPVSENEVAVFVWTPHAHEMNMFYALKEDLESVLTLITYLGNVSPSKDNPTFDFYYP